VSAGDVLTLSVSILGEALEPEVFVILDDETSVYKEEDAFGSMLPVESTSGDVIVLVPDASEP